MMFIPQALKYLKDRQVHQWFHFEANLITVGRQLERQFECRFPKEGEAGHISIGRFIAEGATSYIFDVTMGNQILKIAKRPDEIENENAHRFVTRHETCFYHEADVLRHIDSPHVVRIERAGTCGDRDFEVFVRLRHGTPEYAFPTLEHLLQYQGMFGPYVKAVGAKTDAEREAIAEMYRVYAEALQDRDLCELLNITDHKRPTYTEWGELLPGVDAGPLDPLPIPTASCLCYETLAPHLMSCVLQAIWAVHGAGYIHRDLKPDNFFLYDNDFADDPTTISAQLGDFQTAARLDSQKEYVGFTRGSERYSSPEMLQNALQGAALEPIGPTSDIFSIGEIIARIINPKIKLPSVEDRLDPHRLPDIVHAMTTDMPEPYHGIVRRCLAHNPADRYQSAQTILDDVKKAEPGLSAPTLNLSDAEHYARAVTTFRGLKKLKNWDCL